MDKKLIILLILCGMMLSANGSGDIRYSGSPAKGNENVKGSGNIRE